MSFYIFFLSLKSSLNVKFWGLERQLQSKAARKHENSSLISGAHVKMLGVIMFVCDPRAG